MEEAQTQEVPDVRPEGERWDPLGAPNDQDSDEQPVNDDCQGCSQCHKSITKLKNLEQEQEMLNSSLLALTTHFAQVQFRLKQIVSAPPNEKEDMLKALEEFAFKGVPDIHVGLSKVLDRIDLESDENALIKAVQIKHNQHQELIEQLKKQLKELETYAFEIGEAGIPQDVLLERQTVILDELKIKMNLNVDEMQPQKLTAEELRYQVNKAVGNIVSPYKMKEHLVNQLKTQVADLERFIQYLQADVMECKQCNCCQNTKHPGHKFTYTKGQELHDSIHMVKRAASLLQMFALLQFGCGEIKSNGIPHHFRRNDLKNPMKVNHWGDVRARLQMAVSHILDMVQDQDSSGDYKSDTDESPTVACNVKVTCAVRKHLALSLKDLMQHGLTSDMGQNNSLVPFIGCFSKKSQYVEETMHAWELIMMYYTLKNGDQYNTTPARKLSQSFNLDIVGGTVVSNKQSLLSTIGTILSTHSKYKRGHDSHFKAFVCAALNCNKLVVWLKLIYQCRQLIQMYYYPWSYTIQTGFQDALHCLDALTSVHFDLPVDLAVRQFQSIKDVFT